MIEFTEYRAELIKSFSLLKRNALAAPFERAFTIQKQLEANPPASDSVAEQSETMELHYRSVLLPTASPLPPTDANDVVQTGRSNLHPPSPRSSNRRLLNLIQRGNRQNLRQSLPARVRRRETKTELSDCSSSHV